MLCGFTGDSWPTWTLTNFLVSKITKLLHNLHVVKLGYRWFLLYANLRYMFYVRHVFSARRYTVDSSIQFCRLKLKYKPERRRDPTFQFALFVSFRLKLLYRSLYFLIFRVEIKPRPANTAQEQWQCWHYIVKITSPPLSQYMPIKTSYSDYTDPVNNNISPYLE